MHALAGSLDSTRCSVVNHRMHTGRLFAAVGVRSTTAYLVLFGAAFACGVLLEMVSVWATMPCAACIHNMRTAVCSSPYNTEHQHFQYRAALLDDCPSKTISRGTEDPCQGSAMSSRSA